MAPGNMGRHGCALPLDYCSTVRRSGRSVAAPLFSAVWVSIPPFDGLFVLVAAPSSSVPLVGPGVAGCCSSSCCWLRWRWRAQALEAFSAPSGTVQLPVLPSDGLVVRLGEASPHLVAGALVGTSPGWR